MRSAFFLALALAGVLSAQAPAQPSPAEIERAKAAAKAAVEQAKPAQSPAAKPAQPGQPAPPAQVPAAQGPNVFAMPAESRVATVDGLPVTAGDLQAIVRSLPPQVQQQALQNPQALLAQYGVMRKLAAEAEKNKLDQQNPWKQAIENGRMQVLAQAQMNQTYANGIKVPDEDVKAAYEKNKDRYSQAKVKAVYLPFASPQAQQTAPNAPKPMTEQEAKSQADAVVKLARSGADFVKLVKEYSKDPTSSAKDGDFGTITKSAQIPEPVKTAIFSAKVGEVTEPVRQPNGFYVFKVEEISTQPFTEAQAQIREELKSTRFQQWITDLQKSVQVKIEGETSQAASQPPQPVPAAK